MGGPRVVQREGPKIWPAGAKVGGATIHVVDGFTIHRRFQGVAFTENAAEHMRSLLSNAVGFQRCLFTCWGGATAEAAKALMGDLVLEINRRRPTLRVSENAGFWPRPLITEAEVMLAEDGLVAVHDGTEGYDADEVQQAIKAWQESFFYVYRDSHIYCNPNGERTFFCAIE